MTATAMTAGAMTAGAAPAEWSGLAYGASLAIGLGAAWVTFGAPVLMGTAPYWDSPHGIVGQSGADMLTSLSAYDVFVRDAWRWPLLRVEGLGGAGGTNIAFADGAPGLALVGRGIYRLTGATPVLFGVWVLACFALNALAATALVRQLGARTLVAGVTAALIGVSMPALLARWGHITLMAQGLIPLALLAYLRVTAGVRWAVGLGVMFGQCLLALLTFPYLFFMVSAVAVAGLAQAGLDRTLTRRRAGLCCVALLGGLVLALWALGYLGGDGFADKGFGIYSMNLFSPLVPQVSGIFPGARGMVDATGGQYEGYVYLGAGLLLLSLLAAPELRQRLPGRVRRHALLSIVLAGSLALAVSNEVYAGSAHLLSLPVPSFLAPLTGTVRSSGRLAWIALYLGTALVIATVARWRWATPILLAACLLQWIDAGALRGLMRQSVAAPFATIDRDAWRAALPLVGRVLIDPPFLCIVTQTNQDALRFAAIEIQLKASQAGVPINSVYAARTRADCRVPAIEPGTLFVSMWPDGSQSDGAHPAMPCARGPLLTVCHDRLPPATLAALAATNALPGAADGS